VSTDKEFGPKAAEVVGLYLVIDHLKSSFSELSPV
jgi:hypothetical protein